MSERAPGLPASLKVVVGFLLFDVAAILFEVYGLAPEVWRRRHEGLAYWAYFYVAAGWVLPLAASAYGLLIRARWAYTLSLATTALPSLGCALGLIQEQFRGGCVDLTPLWLAALLAVAIPLFLLLRLRPHLSPAP